MLGAAPDVVWAAGAASIRRIRRSKSVAWPVPAPGWYARGLR